MTEWFHHVLERKSIYTGHAVHQYDDLCSDVLAFLVHRISDYRAMEAQNHPDSCSSAQVSHIRWWVPDASGIGAVFASTSHD
jgi:hypothetical protein